ncbi:MAG: hypothetical protein ACK5P7_06385, partial [Bdellovibrio sp.]
FFESHGFKSATYFKVGFGTMDKVIVLYYVRLGIMMVSMVIFLPFTFWFNLDKFKSFEVLREHFHTCCYPNITHFFWKALLAKRTPFVKIELLRDNPTRQKIDDFQAYLKSCGSLYNPKLCQNHLARMTAKKKS